MGHEDRGKVVVVVVNMCIRACKYFQRLAANPATVSFCIIFRLVFVVDVLISICISPGSPTGGVKFWESGSHISDQAPVRTRSPDTADLQGGI